MQIGRKKQRRNQRDYNKSKVYQSKEWKADVTHIWNRDKGMCQECLTKGIRHYLIRGTKNMDQQGTVDHVEPRPINAPYNPNTYDNRNNLRLIGSRHHAKKSATERLNLKT